jgi:hypothetical protein
MYSGKKLWGYTLAEAVEPVEEVTEEVKTDPFKDLVHLKPGVFEKRQEELKAKEQSLAQDGGEKLKLKAIKPKRKERVAKPNTPNHWINNGFDERKIVKGEYIPVGWKEGRLLKKEKQASPTYLRQGDPRYEETVAKAVYEEQSVPLECSDEDILKEADRLMVSHPSMKSEEIQILTATNCHCSYNRASEVIKAAEERVQAIFKKKETPFINTPETPHEAVEPDIFSEFNDEPRKMSPEEFRKLINGPMTFVPNKGIEINCDEIHRKIILDIEIHVTIKQ